MIMLSENQLNIIFNLILPVLIIIVIFLILHTIFRFIKWILKSILKLLTGNREVEDLTQSDDWLIRAQAKQEIRFQNSLPPIKQKAKPHKLTFRERQRIKQGKSPTGWSFNKETNFWEPPKNIKK